MARIADPDVARDSIEWLQIRERDDEHPWHVMELLQCHEEQADGSMGPRIYGACVAKCLSYDLARFIVCKHNGDIDWLKRKGGS